MLEDKNYINGTAARKLEYDVYEENKVLSAKKKQRTNNKIKMKVIFCLLIVFAMGSLAMYRYSCITEVNYEIDRQLTAYNEIKNENIRIKVEIENSVDIQKIKEFAEKELGMHKPDKHQITYVKVPQSDLTIVSEAAKQEEIKNAGVFSAIINKVNLLANLLY
ncbi:cell division protein FtsL [Acetivibrio mesophilus]|uniref:Cell division protein FtsL n=1 Tax=Acetivibrio mesophilus TaxID=2487273 RepID=A0A4Q0I7G0_9FIRM|nr:cell division protein FtsL [Acetivibrio mesophilus]ODM25176.1 cell division protein FtsL [Clostridium sp. Bc-iso-3]RXE59805.1 cell division protein FtsL [Acetivibrio mesophilus]HHV29586.1 cell division protein FtsL [Clostridium sp.]